MLSFFLHFSWFSFSACSLLGDLFGKGTFDRSFFGLDELELDECPFGAVLGVFDVWCAEDKSPQDHDVEEYGECEKERDGV